MGTTLYNYTAIDGARFTAPATELRLPDGLRNVAVHGLTSGLTARRQYTRLPGRTPTSGPMRLAVSQLALNANAIRAAYNVPTALQGDGQSVGLFQLDHFDANDILQYCRLNNLPLPNITAVYVDGAPGVVQDANVQVEVTLDIELLHAMAPKLAEIRLYEGPADTTFQQYLDVLNEMANPTLGDRKLIRVLSTSYGYFENDLADAALRTEAAIFKQMAAQGQAFFSAAGDTGAYANPTRPNELTVIDPAGQPYVTSVGGTRLSVGAGARYNQESTWAQGGGGSSRFWPTPSYQAELPAASPNVLASSTMRNVPDVSLNADPNTGYAIYVQGATSQVGGTSCGAPQWAGFLALVHQQRAAQNQGPLGFFNPTLYTLRGAASGRSLMHDITLGSNGAYSAATGYDSATGWGSPDGQAFLSAFFLSAPRRLFTAPNWPLK
jgi:kumamolisin